MKPWSQKTYREVMEELQNEFSGDMREYSENYGRTVEEMQRRINLKKEKINY